MNDKANSDPSKSALSDPATEENLARFSRGGSWDLQRLSGELDGRFIDIATVAIGLYASSRGLTIDTILTIEQVDAIFGKYGEVSRSNAYFPLPNRNELNTLLGYQLQQNFQDSKPKGP